MEVKIILSWKANLKTKDAEINGDDSQISADVRNVTPEVYSRLSSNYAAHNKLRRKSRNC